MKYVPMYVLTILFETFSVWYPESKTTAAILRTGPLEIAVLKDLTLSVPSLRSVVECSW